MPQQRQQQQGSPSAEQHDSAGSVKELRPDTKQAGPDGSQRFTLEQQVVATALMVVMGRAMQKGNETAMATRSNLTTNNAATQPLLRMLPEYLPLYTMEYIQHQASDQLMESLTKLAAQCAEAGCQPLEVFTRSAECSARKEVARRISALKPTPESRRDRPLEVLTTPNPSRCQQAERGLQELGARQSMAALS